MRKSRIEVTATEKAVGLLNDPKVKLVGYRTQLILGLLAHERQRKDLAEAREQRKHELRVLKLRAELGQEPKPDAEKILAAARAHLERRNNATNN